MRACSITAAVMLGATSPIVAHAQPSPPRGAVTTASPCTADSGEDIVVCGRPRSDKYRLPPEQLSEKRDDLAARQLLVSRELECSNVGPQGCGTRLLPIVRVAGDGRVIVGEGR